MKHSLLLFCFIAFLFGGCKKDPSCDYLDLAGTVPPSQIQEIRDYLTSQGITDAVQAPNNFFYRVTAAGSGGSVSNLCTLVTATYVGRLKNGTIFDQTAAGASVTAELGQFIIGWQKGVPLVSKGGKITLYIPPALAYGSVDKKDANGNIVIPANSMLIFDIQIINFQ